MVLVAAALAATGGLTATFVSSGGRGAADAATSPSDFVPIEQVQPNVVPPGTGPDASTGRFTVDCGTNGDGKFSADNPVAQPGVRNGAQHVHDFVGNLVITADSSDADLDASDTTCENGDKSAYFWPVVRIDLSTERDNGQPSAAPTGSAGPLPEPQGPNLELPNNTGDILRPASVLIEYLGNPVGKVIPMPKFLRELTGEAKPTSRGPANARATWTCSGFADRLLDKYPICPTGSQVQRVQDFPGCWDGTNIDSANHRDHVAFADTTTGACPQGFATIPQLRITLSYDIPQEVQAGGQYALDSFPEEDHNPASDHNDFINVNSAQTMHRIATCLNEGEDCR
ncbi:DUF1996 domain-containing protein [Mangrovihabitans endophyticus]|uniref:DUF1996 domain-containing protein n=1 Tax=Mangrovihabitans endophyticus TaxID=1751298 RepID=UPI001E46AD64|nr:DUF1996 domain-containing protein [Mangrovihabitans endophyticus]